ncbi:thioesterase family protein [Leisingera daeponensis]|uniref:thioesterase family protein n=1 Tax=Leisingera daeponensis TaxID=405746 RepID=UPI001C985975|nr:thioesterase family protein [Leisingera daeponensis]MBY6058028.1 thioesterase family protein [Leisingera daeponensis]
MPFLYQTKVQPDWIDYNGHMQDAYYGLVFSHAVDALQDAVGFDAAYRKRTGCTIYLIEDHKFYLREVREAEPLLVTTHVLASDSKRFHLQMIMTSRGAEVCIGEFMELHVQQQPQPHAVPMPDEIQKRLEAARDDASPASWHRLRSRPFKQL